MRLFSEMSSLLLDDSVIIYVNSFKDKDVISKRKKKLLLSNKKKKFNLIQSNDTTNLIIIWLNNDYKLIYSNYIIVIHQREKKLPDYDGLN